MPKEYIVREDDYPLATGQTLVGELVRCKDCVCWGTRWKMKESLVEYGDCLHLKDTSIKSDFFCAWGERR